MVDHSSTEDTLSPLVATLRMRGVVLATVELADPWGFHADGFDDVAFYFVARGRALIRHERTTRTAEAGDLLVVAPRRRHSLRDRAGTPTVPFESLRHARRRGRGSNATTLVCGCFQFDASLRELLLPCLPPVVLARASASDPVCARLLEALAAETQGHALGRDAIRVRIAEAVFIACLRACVAEHGAARGWLRALADVELGHALAAFHAAPHRTWTVASLARRAGVSRSAFAVRFVDVVGEPPLAYVTRWRMVLAAGMLTSGGLSIKEVASRVGYGSDESFCRVFRRVMGLPPGRYRERAAQPAQGGSTR